MDQEKLRIKTVSGDDEEITFSPEEMQPVEVAEALESDLLYGKTDKQVRKAKRLFGINEIRSEFRLSFGESLHNQIKGLTSLFLMICSILMYLYRPAEKVYLILAVVIAIITFLNAFAEYRASIALRLPKKYSSLKATVIRNGEEIKIDSRGLVPGDIIAIEEGMMIPADCRLIDDMGLSVLETHISGEKSSVYKDSRYTARDGAEAVCANMVYAGSIVTSGHGSAIVCRIGKDTLLRRMREGTPETTPAIIRFVKDLCSVISVASLIACFLLLFMGVAAGADITQWFIGALAIGASSLCDSMVSLCATSLGFGAKTMAEDGMVIKNYNRIRTLAKTNTIMCGRNLAFPPKRIALTGMYFSGKHYDREKRPNEAAEEHLKLMLVCSDARKTTAAEKKQKRGLPEYKGSALDEAIVEYFGEWNKPIGELADKYIRMDAEYTLSGEVCRLLALHNGKNTTIVRGSPENILSRCVGYTLDGTDYKLSDFTRKKILSATEEAARNCSFMIGIACGETLADNLRDITAEDKLIFKGFVCFSSSLDTGVAEAVYRCENAGIETVLNSDDAYYTAYNSAKSAGIIQDEMQILTAEQLRSTSQGLLIANSPYYRLFLNITDDEWQDIITYRKDNKRTVAVTAERINELSIMSEADVSIVPESSCDTLRQTADALLLGTGINLIADGIWNAKTICRRISSVIYYLPAAMMIMLISSIFSICYNQTPVFRAQDIMFGGIIFNLAFAFALAFEPRHVKDLRYTYPFHHQKPKLIDFAYPLMFSVGGGIMMFIISTAMKDNTCALISLSLLLFLYACSVGGHGGVFAMRRFGNRLLYLCGLGVLLVLAGLMFIPLFKGVFGYARPHLFKLIFATVLTIAYFVVSQILRYFLSPNTPMGRRTRASAKRVAKAVSDTAAEMKAEKEEDYEEEQEELDFDEIEKHAIFENQEDFFQDLDEDKDEENQESEEDLEEDQDINPEEENNINPNERSDNDD